MTEPKAEFWELENGDAIRVANAPFTPKGKTEAMPGVSVHKQYKDDAGDWQFAAGAKGVWLKIEQARWVVENLREAVEAQELRTLDVTEATKINVGRTDFGRGGNVIQKGRTPKKTGKTYYKTAWLYQDVEIALWVEGCLIEILEWYDTLREESA